MGRPRLGGSSTSCRQRAFQQLGGTCCRCQAACATQKLGGSLWGRRLNVGFLSFSDRTGQSADGPRPDVAPRTHGSPPRSAAASNSSLVRALSHAHADTATVLGNELNSCSLEGMPKRFNRHFVRPHRANHRLQSLYRSNRHVRQFRERLLIHLQQSSCGTKLRSSEIYAKSII